MICVSVPVIRDLTRFLTMAKVADIGVRAFFCQGGGGAVNHLPKKFLQVGQIFTNSRTETRATRCNNIGI